MFYGFGLQLPTTVKIISSFCIRLYSFLAVSQRRVFGTVTGWQAGRCGFRISAKVRGLFCSPKRPDVCEFRSATYLMGNSVETSETNAPKTRSHNLEERILHVYRCESLLTGAIMILVWEFHRDLIPRKEKGISLVHKSCSFCLWDQPRLKFNRVNFLLPLEVQESRRETEHPTKILPLLRMRGAIPPLSHMP